MKTNGAGTMKNFLLFFAYFVLASGGFKAGAQTKRTLYFPR